MVEGGEVGAVGFVCWKDDQPHNPRDSNARLKAARVKLTGFISMTLW